MYAEYGAEIGEFAFIFPNRRAGLFFRKYLTEISDSPLFSPVIITINDLFIQLSGKQSADRISMLFILYSIYIRVSAWDETFDEFVFWGEMLLNDFDDVDKYMVDARMLFTNVTDLKEIDAGYGHLSENQIAAIRAFWSSFNPRSASRNQQSFQSVWKILYPLYMEFKAALAAQGKGYEGMIFREVVEKLRNEDSDMQLPYRKLIFVGLNALSVAEEKMLTYFRNKGIADFYWDYASPNVNDHSNKASLFVKRNLAAYPCPPSFSLHDEEKNTLPEIEIIGIPSAIGQAKHVYSILDEMQPTDEDALRTAIVLPDERLLLPVLNAIPESVKNINVTMGYPLAITPVASLIDFVASLQRNIRYVDGQPMFYFRDVLPILNHRYVTGTDAGTVARLAHDIARRKMIMISSEQLQLTELLACIFSPVEDPGQMADYLLKILDHLAASQGQDIENEFIFHYHATISRMKDVMQETAVQMNQQTFFRLLKRLTASISIPFQGEPLSGLQIMGILETRALDFDRLIILSMNEGIFPKKQSQSSFIPYNLRRGFGLPTYEHQDSIWAYHFYRLIHRVKKLTLIYDSRTNGLQTGEMSRYIHQLHYHYNLRMNKKLVIYNVSSSKRKAVEIKKNNDILQRLDLYRKDGGDKNISASAINTWLDCPLKFYFSEIEGIAEEKELTETVESDEFGSIAHKALEELYNPLCGKTIDAATLKSIRNNTALINDTINKAFAEIHLRSTSPRPLDGQDFLAAEMIRRYVTKILELDSLELTPFQYIGSEKRMNDDISIADGTAIKLKGVIDRIDRVEGCATRIVDYKSGLGRSDFPTVESLFDAEADDRPKAVMQVFMYAWMYSRLPESASPLRPTIYYMRNIFNQSFDSAIYLKTARNARERIDDFATFATQFENSLRQCLDNIFNPDIPFRQTSSGKACTWCCFKDLCRL